MSRVEDDELTNDRADQDSGSPTDSIGDIGSEGEANDASDVLSGVEKAVERKTKGR